MEKKQLYFVIFCVILFLVFAGWTLVRSDDVDDQISTLAVELNWQRELKQKCLDNLTYEETRQSLLGFTKPCVQYDERILELKEQLDRFLVKDYMKPMGLSGSRQAQ